MKSKPVFLLFIDYAEIIKSTKYISEQIIENFVTSGILTADTLSHQ